MIGCCFCLGFHEGIANAILLSAFNPVHLHRVGLFYNSTENYETNMNFLMNMALKKIAYAPFAYLVDQASWQSNRISMFAGMF